MLLKISDLDISYNGNATVKNVNLELQEQEVIAIVGESGSGKTTLIRAIMSCLPTAATVTNGSILFNGVDILKNTPKQNRALCGHYISMIFQDTGNMINPIRKIGTQYIDYILNHAPNLDKNRAYAIATEMLLKVHLPNPENIMSSYPFELSGGMRQRVGIAMSLTFNPKILLADEPTSALDVTTQAQIVRQMMDIKKEFSTAIIIVTHNIGVASFMADKIIVMKNGVIVESGSCEQVIKNPQHEYTQKLLDSVIEIGGKRFV